MSDPKKIRNLAKIKAQVRFNPTGEMFDLYTIVDGDKLKSASEPIVNAFVKQEISKISDKPNTVIYRMSSAFSYSDKNAMEDFNYGDVLVEANSPYCLHLPNHLDVAVSFPEQKQKTLVTLEKIWTSRAQTEEGKSDTVDFYAENSPLYHKNSTILGPRMPFNPEDGWDSFTTGKNVEKINDQNGTFRYTRVYIQLKMNLPERIETMAEKPIEHLLDEIQDKALQVVNRLIDNYREITNEIHVRRLGTLKINMIYFISQNFGFYLANLNITTAMMNRSRKEIKEFQKRLASGAKPELFTLLLLNAKNSVDSKDFTMAIVESFQALEIFLENYLIAEFVKRGDRETEYRSLLDKNWRTKDRLNGVLKTLKGVSLNTQSTIWNTWCLHYDKTRNEVFHAGKEPSEMETKETLEINEKVVSWLQSLK